MEPSAACSERLSPATLPFHQLSQHSPLEQDVDDVFSIPPCAPRQCSDTWSSIFCSYSGNMELSAVCSERPLSSQQLSQDSRQEQDAEIVPSQFCLRALQCSDDLSDEQFIKSSIQEENFDKAKSELVCSSNG